MSFCLLKKSYFPPFLKYSIISLLTGYVSSNQLIYTIRTAVLVIGITMIMNIDH